MPRRGTVPPLLEITLQATGNIIANALTEGVIYTDLGDKKPMDDFQKYICDLPVCLKEKILHHCINCEHWDKEVRFGALKSLLCPYMTKLSVGSWFHPTYFSSILEVISCQGTTLTSLDLNGFILGAEPDPLQKVLRCLKNIRELRIQGMATDAVLETIGQYNTALELLDIRGNCNMTEVGVESLCNASNLQFVYLGELDASPKLVSLLIKNLPKLKSLGDYLHVGQAIELAVKESEGIVTNMITVRDSCTDKNRIGLLIDAAPVVKTLNLVQPSEGVISQLSHFPEVSHIILDKLSLGEFFSLTDKIGTRLTTLELEFASGVLDFSVLSKQCPNLDTLMCYRVDFIDSVYPDKYECKKLRSVGVFLSGVSDAFVKNVITASPNIEKLYFHIPMNIKDKDILDIFTTREYSKLEWIWFSDARCLTSYSVNIIVYFCPNLMSLRDLRGWHVSENELKEFKERFKAENIAVKLTY